MKISAASCTTARFGSVDLKVPCFKRNGTVPPPTVTVVRDDSPYISLHLEHSPQDTLMSVYQLPIPINPIEIVQKFFEQKGQDPAVWIQNLLANKEQNTMGVPLTPEVQHYFLSPGNKPKPQNLLSLLTKLSCSKGAPPTVQEIGDTLHTVIRQLKLNPRVGLWDTIELKHVFKEYPDIPSMQNSARNTAHDHWVVHFEDLFPPESPPQPSFQQQLQCQVQPTQLQQQQQYQSANQNPASISAGTFKDELLGRLRQLTDFTHHVEPAAEQGLDRETWHLVANKNIKEPL